MIRWLKTKLFERLGLVAGAMNKNDRASALHRAWGHVFTNHLSGDYVEFGVYHGASFIESYKQRCQFRNWLNGQLSSPEAWRREVAQSYINIESKFHGLDTFGGMPKNNEENASFAQGTFVADYQDVFNKCLASGMPERSFKLYKGLFADSALECKKNLSPKVAIVNIDGDLYESAKDALDIVKDHIQVVTVLLFDDYNAYNADNRKGERRAFKEFQDQTKSKFEKWFTYHYSGQAFLCVED